jgi:hypothetical protein
MATRNSAKQPPKQSSAVPTFTCDICKKPVEISRGIGQHRPLPHEYKVELAAWQKKNPGPVHDLRDLMTRPQHPELWQLGHLDCLKDIDEDYWFPLDQCATPHQALHWTAHLGHKAWFDPSDWARFIERHFLFGRHPEKVRPPKGQQNAAPKKQSVQ